MLVIKLLLLLIISFPVFSCEFKQQFKIGLYSGAIVDVINEIGLNKSNQISFYSHYFPINNQKADKIQGGIFVSKKKLSQYEANLVFYDDSTDLEKVFHSLRIDSLESIKTSGKTPFEVLVDNIKILEKYTENCEKKFESLKSFAKKVKKKKIKQSRVIFFLGEITEEKLPPMIMLHDGFVEYLIKNKIIQSYQSPLSYVTWSEKLMKEYVNGDYLYIGLNSKSVDFETERINENKMNIYSRYALQPGLSQIKFLEMLKEKLF